MDGRGKPWNGHFDHIITAVRDENREYNCPFTFTVLDSMVCNNCSHRAVADEKLNSIHQMVTGPSLVIFFKGTSRTADASETCDIPSDTILHE